MIRDFKTILKFWYKWRCEVTARRLGIIRFNFTTERQIKDPMNWRGHSWQEYREFLKELKRDREKDVPVSDDERNNL